MTLILMKKSLQACDKTICDIANTLENLDHILPENLLKKLGKYLKNKCQKKEIL